MSTTAPAPTPVQEAQAAAHEAVAHNVRVGMARRGLTVRTLAEAIGVGHLWVRRRLSGDVRPTLDDLVHIAAVLETTPTELITPDAERPAYFPGAPRE